MIISGFYFLFIDMLYYQILLNLFTKYTTILRKITVEKMKLHIIDKVRVFDNSFTVKSLPWLLPR